MKKYERLFKELSKQYSVEEIAGSMLIPEDLTEAERKEANEQLKMFRLKMMQEQTETDRIFSDLMRLKILMEDYIRDAPFSEQKSFGKHLEEYARILKLTKKRLAEDLAIHYTRLSRIINGHEEPNIELAYRLEKHSGGLISALEWWRLVVKKQEYTIKIDDETRVNEGAKVKNPMSFAG
ncbi:helix-turn-helix transcriptional regulator [Phaeodactylibacter xiamenensis]|jgi:plasmid maintenance system antidote protein VapI|uniref:helix-turn-helix transcriptional regulator n=1 Tax=Phaeodactylibacter xiamenensis TaxID=1524460 RepID=UPI0024A9F495|nr:helix-turn-helix domain-containing protein [Phaeodactylibacter xiamenensis]